jgi:prolyl-tRNA synthetase
MKQEEKGITIKKEDNFTEWFIQLVTKAKLVDYTDVSGAMAYRPDAYRLWEKIQHETDKEFKKIGMQNVSFPLFIPEKLLSKMGEHVKGFAPEVAWVTQAGNKKLNEKLGIRPTSEAIIYPSLSKWIRSHKDLPKLFNQWCSVVRWEFNNPVLFFRTREFLWNECHNAFASKKEAIKHGEAIIKAYNKITENFMALPGIYGKKTEREKFAGAEFTKKVHSYLPNGRILEGTCFHYDGQKFAKSYNIKFQDKDDKEKYVYQNTHAITTRMLGGMLAMHSDNKGLVIPPKMISTKLVIIPLLFKGKEKNVLNKAKEIFKELKSFNPILDDSEEYSPGYKFAEYELKGIPLRIEIGPRDLEKNSVIIKTRIGKEKIEIKIKNLKKEIPKILIEIQKTLYENAKKLLKKNIKKTENEKELIKFIKEKQMVKVPLKDSAEAEEALKQKTSGAKVLFIDHEKESAKKKKCIITNESADYWVYVGKTY